MEDKNNVYVIYKYNIGNLDQEYIEEYLEIQTKRLVEVFEDDQRANYKVITLPVQNGDSNIEILPSVLVL